ncbi:MAG: hypothetical protein QOG03_1892 [Actinomycetota bacterium]|jgi:hypothetical protein|nr:hypothetical protein [Actinomycetota bacterium]
MAHTFDVIDDPLAEWIGRQHVFFVATAPSDGGHVNCSPKGLDTFAVLDPTTVAYLDLTGSGVETISHLRENGRICVMFCSFEGAPRIVRLQGTGEVLEPDHPDFAAVADRFPTYPGGRAVIRVTCERIADSCGYAVPIMSFEHDRDTLPKWAEKRGADGLVAYRAEKNAESIDGLPGLIPAG